MAWTLPTSPVSFHTHPSVPLESATSGSQFLLHSSCIHIIANTVPSAWNALPSFQGNLPIRQTTYHSSRQLRDHLLYVFTLIPLVGVSYVRALLCPVCLLVYFHYTVALNGKDFARFIFIPPVPSTTPSMNQICACVSCSVVSDSVTPWTVARQASLSMRFPRQEHWSGLPFPSPGDLPNPGIEPASP